jgi:hypothetical protein
MTDPIAEKIQKLTERFKGQPEALSKEMELVRAYLAMKLNVDEIEIQK